MCITYHFGSTQSLKVHDDEFVLAKHARVKEKGGHFSLIVIAIKKRTFIYKFIKQCNLNCTTFP